MANRFLTFGAGAGEIATDEDEVLVDERGEGFFFVESSEIRILGSGKMDPISTDEDEIIVDDGGDSIAVPEFSRPVVFGNLPPS